MPTGKMIVNVVDVGQGQCTFVEIYDLLGNLTNTLLLDCGSDHESDPETDLNLRYVASKIKAMNPPALDLLLFSHSDKDHVSLMKPLLEICLPTKPKIGRVVYGGNRGNYTKYNTNILTYLVKNQYCADNVIVGPSPNSSGFDRKTEKFEQTLWKNADGDVQVCLLAGNVLSDDPENAMNVQNVPLLKGAQALNRVSLVCSVTYNKHTYIICGDATNSVMGWVNWYLQKPRFDLVPMVTLPHHGSRSTGLDSNKGSKKKKVEEAADDAIKTVRTFAQICNAKTVTASSFENFGHPSMELVDYFIDSMAPKPLVKDAQEKSDVHSMVSYVDMKLRRNNQQKIGRYEYQTYLTQTNLYGTNHYNPKFPTTFAYKYGSPSNPSVEDPPTTVAVVSPHACWVYGNDNQNNAQMIGVMHLPPSLGTFGTIFTEPVKGGQSVAPLAPALPRSNPRRAVVPSLARLRHFR